MSLIGSIFEKSNKCKFSFLTQLFRNFFIKIQPNMNEQEKKWQRIYDLLKTQNKSKTISEIFGVSSWPLSSPDRNPLDYAV